MKNKKENPVGDLVPSDRLWKKRVEVEADRELKRLYQVTAGFADPDPPTEEQVRQMEGGIGTVKFRPIRELLEDAMSEAVEINSMKDLINYIFDEQTYGPLTGIRFSYQGFDERIEWDTWLVLVNGFPVGYTDGVF